MTSAMGPSISFPGSPLWTARGNSPSAVTRAVMKMGTRRLVAPRMAASIPHVIFSSFPHQEKSLRLGHTCAQRFGRDTLLESHVLAAYFHLQRTSHLVGAKIPPRGASRPVSAFAYQKIVDGIFAAIFIVKLTSLERYVTQDRECRRELLVV